MSKSLFNTAVGLLAIAATVSWGTQLSESIDAREKVEVSEESKDRLEEVTYGSGYAKMVYESSLEERTSGKDIILIANKLKENNLTLALNLANSDTTSIMGLSLGNMEGREFPTKEVFYNHAVSIVESGVPLVGLSPREAAMISSKVGGGSKPSEGNKPLLTVGDKKSGNFKVDALSVYTEQEQGEFINLHSMDEIKEDSRFLLTRIVGKDNEVIGFYAEEWGGSLRESPLAFDMYGHDAVSHLYSFTE